VAAQWPSELDGFEGPGAHLEGGFRHSVAADIGGEPSVDIGGAVNGVAEQARREPFADREPRRVDRLCGVVGKCTGNAFRPDMSPVAIEQFEQKNSPNGFDAGGDPERFLEWKRDLAEDDAIEKHGRRAIGDGR